MANNIREIDFGGLTHTQALIETRVVRSAAAQDFLGKVNDMIEHKAMACESHTLDEKITYHIHAGKRSQQQAEALIRALTTNEEMLDHYRKEACNFAEMIAIVRYGLLNSSLFIYHVENQGPGKSIISVVHIAISIDHPANVALILKEEKYREDIRKAIAWTSIVHDLYSVVFSNKIENEKGDPIIGDFYMHKIEIDPKGNIKPS